VIPQTPHQILYQLARVCLSFMAGVVHGPFELVPGVVGVVWKGVWKLIFYPDGSRAITATAIGIGGDLKGLTFKVYSKADEGAPISFNGFIIYP
jgi:hypothetical protein